MSVFMLINLELIISGIICGVILLQTSIIAPNVFTHLNQNQTRDLLRAIFPKFFLFILFLGVISLIIGIFNTSDHQIHLIVSSLTVILSFICYFIIPATNAAKDNDNKKRFKLLHKISVISTLIILITNFLWIFLL